MRSFPASRRGMPPKGGSLIERRASSRKRVFGDALLIFMRRSFQCRLIDISDEGVCVIDAPALGRGTPVMLETDFGGRCAAVVAYRTGGRMGLALILPKARLLPSYRGGRSHGE